MNDGAADGPGGEETAEHHTHEGGERQHAGEGGTSLSNSLLSDHFGLEEENGFLRKSPFRVLQIDKSR